MRNATDNDLTSKELLAENMAYSGAADPQLSSFRA